MPDPSTPARSDFGRHVGGFTAATLISRILGYLRDFAIVYVFGGGRVADIYFASFRIANLLRRALGEGALGASMVPVLTEERQKGPENAQELFSAIWTAVAFTALVLVVLGILFAGPIVWALNPGFAEDPEKLAWTVDLTRVMFPQLLFVTMAAVLTAGLNERKSFFLPAFAPVMFSLSILGYLGAVRLGWLHPDSPKAELTGLAIACVVGGILQWLIQAWPLAREGYAMRLRAPWKHPGMKKITRLMGPSFLGIASDQINAQLELFWASWLVHGAITALYNSNRLMQLPLALFGIATATVALSHLSDMAAPARSADFMRTLRSGLRGIGFILLPAAAGLIVLGEPIIAALLEHGQFTHQHTLLTYDALLFLSVGLAAYGFNKVLIMAFYALQDAKTPLYLSLVRLAMNAVLMPLLMGPFGVGGITLASAFSAWTATGLFLLLLGRRVGNLVDGAMALNLAKTLAASVAMGLAVWLAARGLRSNFLKVLVGVPLGGAVFFALSFLLRIEERALLTRLVKRA